ncbi:MAG: ribonuclease P protein component [Gammaproteobacteria bacterium]|nr:ribonuclease P protein component [Gammaproteobacteria bacterium]
MVSKNDFQSVFAKSNKVTYRYLVALCKNNQKPHARLGIIVAKRHVNLAVNRNRLRRIIRESFRYHKEALKGLDIILLLRSECTDLDKKILRNDVDHLWPNLMRSSLLV